MKYKPKQVKVLTIINLKFCVLLFKLLLFIYLDFSITSFFLYIQFFFNFFCELLNYSEFFFFTFFLLNILLMNILLINSFYKYTQTFTKINSSYYYYSYKKFYLMIYFRSIV